MPSSGLRPRKRGGAVSGPHGGTWLNHFLSLPKAIAFYVVKLVAPLDLSPRYTLEGAAGWWDPWVIAGGLLAVGAAVALLLARRRLVAGWGVLFFLVTWAPASGVVPSVTFVADRYMYLPAFGLFLAVAALFGAAIEAGRRPRVVAVTVSATCLVLLSGLAVRQVARWQNNETLWLHALEVDHENEFAHNQLAATYGQSGRFQEALDHSVAAVRLGLLKPEYLFNLCRAYRGLDEPDKELACAREIQRGAPDFLPAWLVTLRHAVAGGDDSVALLAELERRFPGGPSIAFAHGIVSHALGQTAEALASFARAYQLAPRDPEVVLGFASSLSRANETDAAIAAVSDALRLPGSAWFPDMWRQLDTTLNLLESHPGTADRIAALRRLAARRRAAGA